MFWNIYEISFNLRILFRLQPELHAMLKYIYLFERTI